jgi:hypothetical protein
MHFGFDLKTDIFIFIFLAHLQAGNAAFTPSQNLQLCGEIYGWELAVFVALTTSCVVAWGST